MVMLPFRNRADAGQQLARALEEYRGRHAVVLAIPRGAVPMGRIVADALTAELDVLLVRKLRAPRQPELAIGAVDEQGQVLITPLAQHAGASDHYLAAEVALQQRQIQARRMLYGRALADDDLQGRIVIVVDDGLATGATMIAALQSVRARAPAELICAVPVAAPDSLDAVSAYADKVVCLASPDPFRAVGQYYRDFGQVDDADVQQALHAETAPARESRQSHVRIAAGRALLEGDLHVPEGARALVIFAHGSGSSRRSPRNRMVAGVLQRQGLATLLFDLLTPREDSYQAARFNIQLLSQRLASAVDWARGNLAFDRLGLFGASTGAAAALRVAAARPRDVNAVISRGGRPDLAGHEVLEAIRCPVLLIVGGADSDVLELNREARDSMAPHATLSVVPGAGHLFEQPGALEQVAAQAAAWFTQKLAAGPAPRQTAGGSLERTLHGRIPRGLTG